MLKMLLRASSNINVILIVLFGLAKGAYLIDFSHIYRTNTIGNVKREGEYNLLFFALTKFHRDSFGARIPSPGLSAVIIRRHKCIRGDVFSILVLAHITQCYQLVTW